MNLDVQSLKALNFMKDLLGVVGGSLVDFYPAITRIREGFKI